MVPRHRTGVSSSYEAEEEPPRGSDGETRPGLVLLYAPNFEQLAPAYPFTQPELVLGREPDCHICIPEQAVSRQHARIAREDDRWILVDLKSRNGTLASGRYVTREPLEHNAEIRIGDAIFKFVAEGAERYVPYRIDGHAPGARLSSALPELVGGWQMDHIAAEIEHIAPTELSCVILGETGTGKEVVARGIHRVSGRRGSLQAINCAAIPQSLLESELFGYRRGAFSGADRDKPGLVKLADEGTLFLDEIGDMPLEAQAKLLRVLQSKEVFPLGATSPERVDIRVVCATHRDLHGHVKDGRFRGDLFARLNEHTVRLPPLRDRKEDIYQLVRAFAARYGKPQIAFSFSFLVALFHHDWPFNVRELESCIKRGVALTGGAPLDANHLPDLIAERMKSYGGRRQGDKPQRAPASREIPAPVSRRKAPSESELRDLLRAHGGNVAAVGRQLGKERMQIHRWIKKFGIDLREFRAPDTKEP